MTLHYQIMSKLTTSLPPSRPRSILVEGGNNLIGPLASCIVHKDIFCFILQAQVLKLNYRGSNIVPY